MTPIVYAAPYTPPAPPPNPWRGIGMRWESPDGSVWSLTGPRAAGVRMRPGVRGLTEPPREQYIDETAGVEGGRYRGSRAVVREVFWPISVWKDTDTVGWLEYDSAWWRSLDPDVPGRWVVTHPDGTERHLLCRFADDGDPGWESAPGMRAWARYGVRMIAVDPYWRGATITRSWSGAVTEGETFVGAGGPPFTISEGSTLATAEVTNPGDITTHLQWWVSDVDGADLSVGDRTIEVPAVAADRMLVIDSDPTELSAIEIPVPPATSPVTGEPMSEVERDAWVATHVLTGTDRTTELGDGTTWGSIPRRSTTALGIVMAGTGTVAVRFVPRYRRAW